MHPTQIATLAQSWLASCRNVTEPLSAIQIWIVYIAYLLANQIQALFKHTRVGVCAHSQENCQTLFNPSFWGWDLHGGETISINYCMGRNGKLGLCLNKNDSHVTTGFHGTINYWSFLQIIILVRNLSFAFCRGHSSPKESSHWHSTILYYSSIVSPLFTILSETSNINFPRKGIESWNFMENGSVKFSKIHHLFLFSTIIT